jgi:hypothetical protein
MTKKIMPLMLIGLLLNLAFYSAVKANDDETTQKVKTSIAKIGVGFKSIVKVKLKDGREFNGFIKQIGEDNFTVEGESGGYEHKILYSEVKQVKQIKRPTSRRKAIAATIVFFVVWGILGAVAGDG